jgi:hypothetical protein
MKRYYLDPEVEVIRFSEADIIITSTPIGEGDDDVPDGVGSGAGLLDNDGEGDF